MYSSWVYSIPVIFFAVIAGALSDYFGRKPIILFPIIGGVVTNLADMLNYALIDHVPMEFFYIDNIGALFGGYAVYYLGTYSYGTDAAAPKDRAHRLARLDGTEILANMVGTILSPYINDAVGFYGTFGIGSAVMTASGLYLIFFVKEKYKTNEESEEKEKKSLWKTIRFAAQLPIDGLKSIVLKKRLPGLKPLIILQLCLFTIYWITVETLSLTYNYLRLAIDGFDGSEYATFSMVMQLANAFYLIIIVPVLNVFGNLHDTLVLFTILIVETAGNIFTGLSNNLWQVYLSQIVAAIGLCKYSLVRTLLSKCIEQDEVGKVFSVLAVIAALAPVGGSPLFKQVFNLTSETRPGTFYLMAGGFCLAAAAGNLVLFFKRRLLVNSSGTEVQAGTRYVGAKQPVLNDNYFLSSI
jgi:MFS family permease